MTTLGEIRGTAIRVQRAREMTLRTTEGFYPHKQAVTPEEQIRRLRRWGQIIEELSAKVNDRIQGLEEDLAEKVRS